MTKELPMTKDQTSARAFFFNSSLALCHYLVISASSLVIAVLVFAVRLYRWTVSPLLVFLFGPAGGCRFTPSCSQYAVDAIRSQGVLAGSGLAVRRICRCHPWADGGHDPAPKPEVGSQRSEFRI
ncbi:MAG: membrane protein insertion efficiency factor YidD [Limisphaerales bacterium]